MVLSFPTTAVGFATGDRLNLAISSPNGPGCNATSLHGDGAGVPSRMTLPG